MADSPQPFTPFSTDEMLETVQTFKTPPDGVTKAFFTTVKQSNTQFHHFEVDEEKRYVAPFVSANSPGKARARRKRRVKSIEAAYVKQTHALRPSDAMERQAGESLGGSSRPADRLKLLANKQMKEDFDAIERRKELMGVDALVKGTNVLEGDDYPREVLDYGRDESLGLANPENTLAGADRWNQAGAKIAKMLRAASNEAVRLSGSWTPDIICDIDAAEAFLDNADVQKKMDLLRYDAGTLRDVAAQKEGLMLLGTYSTFRIWQYMGYFQPDDGSDEQAILSGGHVLGVGAIDGVQGYGAILDIDAFEEYPDGLIPEAIYPKSWVQKNPSALMLQTQCAPILYPRRPNASWVRKVLG